LELFSLEEEAAQLPGGLFVLLCNRNAMQNVVVRARARTELLRNVFVSTIEFDFETMANESA
jgi:hypothetical protein